LVSQRCSSEGNDSAHAREKRASDGTVLYVLQGMRKDDGPITDIATGVMPFTAVHILALLILMWFAGIALWLPQVMK
jgi:TRAP-type C4-dicarboxylate transport system permease large subunit